MPYEQRDNSGTIFKNDRKEKPNQPDRTGTAMIGGKMYRVSGWIKEGQRGQFLSLSFTPADEQRQSTQAPQKQAPRAPLRDEMSDDIPFSPEFR